MVDKELVLGSKTLEVSLVDVEDTYHLQELCFHGDNVVEHGPSVLWSLVAFFGQHLEEADDLQRVQVLCVLLFKLEMVVLEGCNLTVNALCKSCNGKVEIGIFHF